MKKIFLIFLFFNFIFAISFGEENWTKLKRNVFIDYATILNDGNARVGWFKVVEPQQQVYKLEKYKAYCTQDVIEIQQIKIFDKNNTLLEEEINKNNIGCNYNGIVNGKIYYNTLCNNKFLLSY